MGTTGDKYSIHGRYGRIKYTPKIVKAHRSMTTILLDLLSYITIVVGLIIVLFWSGFLFDIIAWLR